MIKKMMTLWLLLALCLNSATTSKAAEVQEEESYAASFQVTEETLQSEADNYSMPTEVKEYIEGIFKKNRDAQVTVYGSEVAKDDQVTARASSGKWGKVRKYNGYSIKDWKVHTTNAFGQTDIMEGKKAGKFAKELLIYGVSAGVDSLIPFGSAGITLMQFATGNTTTKYAGSGDKASAAPKFTSDTKFTYVKVGGDYLLGARTHRAKLDEINWYYYCDKQHKTYPCTTQYGKTFRSPSFKKPDTKAVVWAGNGGYLEEPITLRIRNVDFVLD